MGNLVKLKQIFLACTSCGLLSVAPAAMAQKVVVPVGQKTMTVPDAPAAVQSGLTGEILFDFMLAEVAASRSNLLDGPLAKPEANSQEYIELATQLYIRLANQTKDAQIARRATELSLFTRQLSYVGDASKLWMKIDPSSADAVKVYTETVANGYGKLEDLEAAFSRLLEVEGVSQGALIEQLPVVCARYADKKAVAAVVERLTEPYLSLSETHYARARTQLDAGNLPAANASALRALELKPQWAAALLVKALSVPPESQDKAMEELGAFVQKNPDAREERAVYISWLIEKKRLVEAQEEYKKLLSDFPEDNAVKYRVALLAAAAADLESAQKYLRELIAANFRDVNLLHQQLGEVLELSQRLDDAVVEYKQVRGDQQLSATARAVLILGKQNKLEQVRALLQQAAQSDPKRAPDYELWEAGVLRDQNNFKESDAIIKKLVDKYPNNPRLVYESAMLSDRQKDYKNMEKTLRRAIALKPDYAHAYNALGFSFVERNVRIDEAEPLLRKAIELAPNDPAIQDSVGWLEYRKGNLKVALDYLTRAYTQLRAGDVAAHIGEVQWAMGDKDAAIKTWNDALKEDPKNQELIETMKRFGQK